MGRQATCCCCGMDIEMGTDFGRIDMRQMASERGLDQYGRRKFRRTRAVLTGTVCLECLETIAHNVSAEHGIPMREGA